MLSNRKKSLYFLNLHKNKIGKSINVIIIDKLVLIYSNF